MTTTKATRRFLLAAIAVAAQVVTAHTSLATTLGDAAVSASPSPDACLATGGAQEIAAGHDMTGKTVFLTGGDSGIGYNAALALAGVNASIIIANHNAATGHAAAANISRLTGNPRVEALEVDLGSFASTRALAAALLNAHPALDVLIFDAGIGQGGLPLTKDGFEPVMQINYLGHFLLEQLLLPALRSRKGKLIHVSSGNSYVACRTAGLPESCIDDATALERLVRTQTAANVSNYGLTKLMQIYNSRELALREAARQSGVRAYSIRPGLVSTPLQSHVPDAYAKWLCAYPQCAAGRTKDGRCQTPCPMPASAGAASPTFVAVTDRPQDQDGSLYFQCVVEAAPAWGKDPQAQKTNQQELYEMSLKWTGTGDGDAATAAQSSTLPPPALVV